MTADYNTWIKTAVEAVLAGAKLAETASANQVLNQKGSLRDIVTQADLDISAVLTEKLTATGIAVVSEEHVQAASTPEVFWAVDPIDGTVNFSHGLPHYAVSAGLVQNGKFDLGVVCAPALDELYFTLNPQRALLNGRPITHVHRPLHDTLAAASFSARADTGQYLLFQAVNESTRGCLRSGSAALNICWAAAGKLQLAYGFGAKIWDVAAALAIAKAAGCALQLHFKPSSLTLDYCVGSDEALTHLTQLAKAQGLWGKA